MKVPILDECGVISVSAPIHPWAKQLNAGIEIFLTIDLATELRDMWHPRSIKQASGRRAAP
eukprot:654475-Pyramimonas_sp.AAC.1